MARLTKEEVYEKLDAETYRANKLAVQVASIVAAAKLADAGHMDLEGLIEFIESSALTEGNV